MEDPKQASQKDQKLDEVDRKLDTSHFKLKLIFDKYTEIMGNNTSGGISIYFGKLFVLKLNCLTSELYT